MTSYSTNLFQGKNRPVAYWTYLEKRANQATDFANQRAGQNVGEITSDMILRLLARQKGKCAAAGCPIQFSHAFFEIDHMMPIVRGGRSVESNLQLLCHDCNQEKGILTMREFAQSVKFGPNICPQCYGHKKTEYQLCYECFRPSEYGGEDCLNCGGPKNTGYRLCYDCWQEEKS